MRKTPESVEFFEPTEALALLTTIIEHYPQRSRAIDLLYTSIGSSGINFPCQRISSLDQLSKFLSDKRAYGNQDLLDNAFTSDQAAFIILHPGDKRGKHPAFASLTHHGFTAYSDLWGPKLWTIDPDDGRVNGKKSVPFEMTSQYDTDPRTFYKVNNVHSGTHVYGQEQIANTVFINKLWAETRHGRIEYDPKPKLRVFIPLSRGGNDFDSHWQVYAIPRMPQILAHPENTLPAPTRHTKSPKKPTKALDPEKFILKDPPKDSPITCLVWAGSAAMIAASPFVLNQFGQLTEKFAQSAEMPLYLCYAIPICCAPFVLPAVAIVLANHIDDVYFYGH